MRIVSMAPCSDCGRQQEERTLCIWEEGTKERLLCQSCCPRCFGGPGKEPVASRHTVTQQVKP